jgi:uncharacterized cupin superfamily protein
METAMPDQPPPKPLLTAAEIASAERVHLRHPWNPNSDIYVVPLSMSAGLKRAVLSLARVPPGKESFIYHFHEHDEEFIYILFGPRPRRDRQQDLRGRPRRFHGLHRPRSRSPHEQSL